MLVKYEARSDAYDDLAAELKRKFAGLIGDAKYWLAIVGSPGSGKSTLAMALKARLKAELTVIPMDGYHYYRHELDQMEAPQLAHARRGAPFTFNAQRFVNEIINAHTVGSGVFPGFDHGVGDPVEKAIRLSEGPQVVLVEGNYLLSLEDPWVQLREVVFDDTWYLDVPEEECCRRVYERHLSTGLSVEEARRRVENNDRVNARYIVAAAPARANRSIQIPS